MLVDIPLGGPDLAPAPTPTPAPTTLRSVAAQAITVLTSDEAKRVYKTAMRVLATSIVVGVALSMAVAAHVLVRGVQLTVNTALLAWYTSSLAMLLMSCLLQVSWAAKRRPRVWSVDFTTNWCSIGNAQRVWAWTALTAA